MNDCFIAGVVTGLAFFVIALIANVFARMLVG
jgi:hypothetical protein